MTGLLRFIVLPGTIILVGIWIIVLRCRVSLITRYLLSVGALLFVIRLLGLNPLGFFVSFGGYAWFAMLASIAAVIARG
jgi:hypothetical protein